MRSLRTHTFVARPALAISALQHVELAIPSCWPHPNGKSTIISPPVWSRGAGASFRRRTAALWDGQSLDAATWWIAAVLNCIVKCGPLCLIGYWEEMTKGKKRERERTRDMQTKYWNYLVFTSRQNWSRYNWIRVILWFAKWHISL